MENRDTICLENLSKQYGDFTALHKISFEIPKKRKTSFEQLPFRRYWQSHIIF
ncbi:MAG: hypothetical protein Q4A78_02975 [Peptostreptococcaceae bacterium]|nr:hypothetical protein [Peptostreptococcaceae bacterium]